MHVARQVWPSRSPSLFIDQKCRRSLRWRVFECKISRSLHMPCRLLACLLSSLCARGATGNGPTDQCWRRQAEARRRLCVLSAWCLCASEEKRTRVAGIYSCITLLGIASPPGSWRLGGLPEMRRRAQHGAWRTTAQWPNDGGQNETELRCTIAAVAPRSITSPSAFYDHLRSTNIYDFHRRQQDSSI